MSPDVKPGWRTSEWWTTILGQLVALLVALAVIKTGDAGHLTTDLNNGVVAAFALIASSVNIWKYIQSRTEIKTTDPAPNPPATPPY